MTNIAAPAVLVALAACGPALGTSDGDGSATAASTGDQGSSLGSNGSGSGATTAALECSQSDLPPPFCHVAQSYGSTLETDSNLVPRILMPILSPGEPAKLLIQLQGQFQLVEAKDFSHVFAVSNAALFGSGSITRFIGDFSGDGVIDLGVVDYGHPVELYDGIDLSLLAVGPDPRIPGDSNEVPSGWPAAAIDDDGDGVDEVATVELGHGIGIWRVESGTLEWITEHQDVMTPCPGAFLQADFNGDGKRDLAVPTSGASCWDGLGIEDTTDFTIRLIPSPVPNSIAELPTKNQPNWAYEQATDDLDGDMMADVVLADYARITLLRSNGEDFDLLESTDWAELGVDGSTSELLAVGDVDGDGRSEIVVSVFDDQSASNISRLHWEGTLKDMHYSFSPEFVVHDLVDLNEDGRAEIIASQIYPSAGREVFIYWSQN